MAGISDLLVLDIIAGGIYYAASTGMLNNILPQQATTICKSITNRSFSRRWYDWRYSGWDKQRKEKRIV